ANSRLPTSII
nr:Chain C, L-iCAL36 peptide [synthetic construct]4JOF_D Chain D, L-iCAL36 peptide [synthetic construct]